MLLFACFQSSLRYIDDWFSQFIPRQKTISCEDVAGKNFWRDIAPQSGASLGDEFLNNSRCREAVAVVFLFYRH